MSRGEKMILVLKIVCAILLADMIKGTFSLLCDLVLEAEKKRDEESVKDKCVVIDINK